MITELSEEQIARLPEYVDKWIKIGLNTDPCNLPLAKQYISEAYKVAGLEPPKYFFHFSSPNSTLPAIYMVDKLSAFDDTYQDTAIHSDTSEWLHIFDNLYNQYSAQYKDITWDDNVKDRMLSFISKAYLEGDKKEKYTTYHNQMLYGAHEADYLSFYDFFHKEFDLECTQNFVPYFNLAEVCGWWSPYEECAFVQDRPSKIVMNEDKTLHNREGAALEYPDGFKIFCIDGYQFPEHVVMDPHLITIKEIDDESTSEKRRIMLELFGEERYFQEAEVELIDRDFVSVSVDMETAMPRMLVRTGNGDVYLIGTDGSTERKYFMNVSSKQIEDRVGKITTCKQAHELISGLSEGNCLSQS